MLGSPPFIATAAVGAPAIPASASGGGGAARELRTFAKTLEVAAAAAAAAAVRVAAMEGTPEHATGGGVGVDGGGGSAEPRRIPAGYAEEARLAEPLSVAAVAASVEGARVAAAAAAAAAAPSRKSPPPPRAPRAPLSAPVDAVWTHVTADDAAWRRAYTAAVAGEPADALSGVPDALRGSATMRALSRGNKFRDWGELRYSMRSLAAHAPWLRRFFVVVAGAGQVPRWLNASHPRLTIVYHAELFAAAGAADALPTFNSLAIESVLHHLPGVAPRFLYVNNDVMLGRATSLDDFISPRDGAHVNFLDWRIGMSQECSALVYATDGPPAPEDPAYAAAGCFAQPFVYDVVLALAKWGVMLYFWPPHMPHLWETAALAEIEERLAPQFAVARRNRLRDAASDVSMHMQHEAWFQAAAAAAGGHVLDVAATDMSYAYALFEDGTDDDAWAVIAARAAKRPQFLAIDDDLLAPSEERSVFHRAKIKAVLSGLAPDAAPWELVDADGALIA